MSRPLPDAAVRRPNVPTHELFRVESTPAVTDASSAFDSERAGASAPGPDFNERFDALMPRGIYARMARPVCEALLVLAVLPFALVIAVPIACVNWIVFRDVKKILFRQERVGHRGRVFWINKFRTMKEVEASAFDSWGGTGDAARVTRFGRFLRNSHLDELPQLINVVCGDMSLIGPRPEMVEIEEWANEAVPGFSERLAVRPGITGWAQITQGYVGRCTDGYTRKHELGLQYLARFGALQDLGVLARTALWMLRRQGWRWQQQGETSGDATKQS